MDTVDEATADTAALLRRVVRRALTILGGSVAGTAIAWAISSASASADPQCQAPELSAVPGVAQIAATEAGRQVVHPLSDVVCAARQQLVPVSDLGTGARQTADDVGRSLGLAPRVPIDIGGLGRSDRPGASASGGGTHEPSSLVRPAGDASAAAPTIVIAHRFDPDTIAARSATDRALGDGMSRRGSPAPVAPFAPIPVPTVPASTPGTGSSGHTGGGADSPAFAALSWSAGESGLTAGQTLPAAELLPVDEPGTQPGVTPD